MSEILHIKEKGEYVLLSKEEFEMLGGSRTNGRRNISKLLEEGYIAMAKESVEIAKEWEIVDLENRS
ncbi:MAG: hypothetical protein HYW25_04580 [Candidatus Aenigmarchaeota archaeon]|nr:hypothetical protein [Candidatus Aenigmarchaeota archaeon]